MKTQLTTVLLLFTLFSWGQTGFNKRTEKDQKIGKWAIYYDNGKIKEITEYEPIERILNEADAFFYGINIEYSEKLVRTETYEYNENWDLTRIVLNNSTFLYGKNQELEIRTDKFTAIGKVNEIENIGIELTNHSDKAIQLKTNFVSTEILTDIKEILLLPKQTKTVDITIKFSQNEKQHLLKLENESISIDISINLFGFDLSTADIKSGKKLVVSKNFIYYRTGNEALLKIYDIDKKKELETISLVTEKTKINLEKINKDKFWFCLIDYSTNEKKYCEGRWIKE